MGLLAKSNKLDRLPGSGHFLLFSQFSLLLVQQKEPKEEKKSIERNPRNYDKTANVFSVMDSEPTSSISTWTRSRWVLLP